MPSFLSLSRSTSLWFPGLCNEVAVLTPPSSSTSDFWNQCLFPPPPVYLPVTNGIVLVWLGVLIGNRDSSGLILNLGFLRSDPRTDPGAGFCPQCLNRTLREHQDSSLGRMNVRMREHIVCLRGWDRVTRWGGATCSGMFTWICHCIY